MVISMQLSSLPKDKLLQKSIFLSGDTFCIPSSKIEPGHVVNVNVGANNMHGKEWCRLT